MTGRCEFTFTIGSDVKKLSIYIYNTDSTSSHYSAGDYIELRNIKLEEGSAATAWSPSIEETTGSDGYTVILSNENHTFPGGTSAALADSVECEVVAYKGATQVAATIGTITGQPTGMTTSISNNSTTSAKFTVAVTTSMTTQNGVLTVPVTVDGITFTKKFTYSVAFVGASAYTVILTNESHTFVGSSTAAIADSVSINVLAYKGATSQTPTIGTITGAPTGMTTSVSGSTITVTVTTSLTTKSGELTIPVTIDGITFNKKFSWALALAGTDGSPGSAGSAATSYFLLVDTSVITKNKSGTLSPTSFTVKGYSKTGTDAVTTYSGRFKI